MRRPGVRLRIIGRAALPLAALLALLAPAGAQVTLNLSALNALPVEAAPPPTRHAPRRPVRRPPHRTVRARTPVVATSGTAGSKPVIAASKPSAPAGGPPAVAASMPTLPATAPAPPPPAVIALAPPAPALAPAPPGAPGAGATQTAPDRTLPVAFAADHSDLAAGDVAAIEAFARAAPRTETTSFEVAAYAQAIGGDASTARRLSLARALAVRAALVDAGVPAASIYVRALGTPPVGQPPGAADRAVVTLMGANGPQPAPKAAASTTTPAATPAAAPPDTRQAESRQAAQP